MQKSMPGGSGVHCATIDLPHKRNHTHVCSVSEKMMVRVGVGAQAVKMKGFKCGCISNHLVVQEEMDFHGQHDNAIQASSLLIESP